MKIMVFNKLTYESDVPVEIGDYVELPANIYNPENWLAKVTSLDSNYQGPLKKIIRNHGKNKNALTIMQEKRIELEKQEQKKRIELEKQEEVKQNLAWLAKHFPFYLTETDDV